MDDRNLLGEYVEHQSEAAFAGLVSRHVDLVYSTALRAVRDAAQAEDVAQSVFVELARKAGTIRDANALPGWLYRVTRRQAARQVNADRLRRQREIEAMNLAELDTKPSLAWDTIASTLDEAMDSLEETEQNAVVLRFFQGRSWRDVASALAASEDTAQRRVSSGLEKLRAHFLRRGVTVSASVLAMAIGTNAVQAAPATLGPHLAAGALAAAGGTKGAGIVTSFIKTLLAKWQIAAVVVTGVAVVGVTTTAVISHHTNTVNAELLRRGLVLHLGFDQEKPEGRVSDDSGMGNQGQVTGARWTAHGKQGGAYEFRADGDQIAVPNHPSLNPTNVTVSAWIKCPAADANWRFIVDKSVNPGYTLSVLGDGHENTTRGRAHSQMSGAGCVYGGIVTDGRWHLLTTTYDGIRHLLYVDGRQEIGPPLSKFGLSNSLDLIIGRHSYNKPTDQIGLSFRGVIDDVRVYNRALSPTEVSLLFALADR